MNTKSLSDLHLKLRNLENEDYPQVGKLMEEIYPDIGGAWSKRSLSALIKDFPEGQIVIEDNGNVIAVALTVMCSYDRFNTINKITRWFGAYDVHYKNVSNYNLVISFSCFTVVSSLTSIFANTFSGQPQPRVFFTNTFSFSLFQLAVISNGPKSIK